MQNTPDTPVVVKYHLRLDPPTGEDPRSDMRRLTDALGAKGVGELYFPLALAAKLPGLLRGSGFELTASVCMEGRPYLVEVEPGDTSASNLGLAIDLGTTNVVGMFVEMSSRTVVAEASAQNPQMALGEDVLTRIHHCLKKGGLEELSGMAVSCINDLANELCAAAGAALSEIGAVSVSGNTTMAHLFLGLDPYGICRAPYTPVANRFGRFTAGELGLDANTHAPVFVLPNTGSYVGGDVLAGVLVSGMHKRDGVSVLVDVGTNAEIVIGNSDWLLVCAGAAGPALEGGVVRHGMRAMNGAIDRVSIDPDTLLPKYTVIGGPSGARPRGLCGSALIDLLAELFLKGIIDGRGKFVEGPKSGRVVEVDGTRAYLVVPAADSGTGADVVFTETDIDNLIRTKAAMFTVLYVVTRELGIGFKDIKDFFIAGTFGEYIAADKAVAIGMVPDIDIRKYSLLGNSSIRGACEVLYSTAGMAELHAIADLITYKEMNVSSEFMTEFRAAMFLPHTDSSFFPSVKSG
jgi:uncharacterized 2Fe-2S/4Fe-4S cluster protein (DUF4445 family)